MSVSIESLTLTYRSAASLAMGVAGRPVFNCATLVWSREGVARLVFNNHLKGIA